VTGSRWGWSPSAPSSAALWEGTSGSYVDLHPAVAMSSSARGASGGVQVGSASVPDAQAALWSGSADSFTSLHPAGATLSRAFGVHEGQQVGWAIFDTEPNAVLWTGSAASAVNLHPAGASISEAWAAVHSGVQAGVAVLQGVLHAGLWTGSAESWFSLHELLPADYTESEASGVWVDGDVIEIVGTAFDGVTVTWHAVLWVYGPEP
jgi:hypothetical protein